jgi:hypothetical protein
MDTVKQFINAITYWLFPQKGAIDALNRQVAAQQDLILTLRASRQSVLNENAKLWVRRLQAITTEPPGLCWSPERPTDSGWYFVRVKGDQLDIEIVLVRGDTPTCPKYALEHGRKDRYMLDRYTDECEWYGPLMVPEAN